MTMKMSLSVSGVVMNTPPASFKGAIDESIKRYVGETGNRDGVYLIATYQRGKIGTNLVVVKNIGDQVDIKGYIGKTWGEPIEGGIQLAIDI